MDWLKSQLKLSHGDTRAAGPVCWFDLFIATTGNFRIYVVCYNSLLSITTVALQ